MSEAEEIEQLMKSYDFEEWHTGGGCKAYRLELEDGRVILITDYDSYIPMRWSDKVLVGLYDDMIDDDEVSVEDWKSMRGLSVSLKNGHGLGPATRGILSYPRLPLVVTHSLKTWPEYFEALRSGKKTFDIRRADDREYAVGNFLSLHEYDHDTAEYTAAPPLLFRVTYILRGPAFGVQEGFVVMGIQPP